MKESSFQEICSIQDVTSLEKEESHKSPFVIPTGCDSELKTKLLHGTSIKSFVTFWEIRIKREQQGVTLCLSQSGTGNFALKNLQDTKMFGNTWPEH